MRIVASEKHNGETIQKWEFSSTVLPQKGETVFFGVKGPYEVTERIFLYEKESGDDRPDVNLVVREIPKASAKKVQVRF
ncbi:hypothetical protein [Celeribacter halophilus]|uniref:Uncharacterized protein n=1 Tax=Celeribacter halophilus TaxID=576117 RepID=A0A1I3NQM6_9RHOB|nr:hypothetical protein [Celeribacter halophilus]PZX14601.1 hypothetical protein LX82_00389 [Celeribacter halophilus]SFJ11447.1 hypothetical protein SAMN04488138_10238 [Celeribacter halophilus]